MRGQKFIVVNLETLAAFGGTSGGRQLWQNKWILGYRFDTPKEAVDFGSQFDPEIIGIYSVQQDCVYDLTGNRVIRYITDEEIREHL